jgi:N-glycosylase/DNA lyase
MEDEEGNMKDSLEIKPPVELIKIYVEQREEINKRLEEFKNVFKNGTSEEIFAELIFCICTPQSNAKSCWAAVERLIEKKILKNGSAGQIAENLAGVRFHNNKSRHIVKARENFSQILEKIRENLPIREIRKWLAENVTGFGYKESSHFLRNIGFGEKLAILDRHILRTLVKYEVIPEIPKNLNPKKYIEIENKMEKWSKKIKIPSSPGSKTKMPMGLAPLDIVIWYSAKNEIFK